MSSKPLAGKVCLVTGATRGIGKGIAVQLGVNGAKVYVTGRTLDPPRGSKLGGSLRETADEIEARGGQCVPVKCDHGNDEEVERLFELIQHENDGQLDLLVNNAYSAVSALFGNIGVKFWDQPISMWDEVNNVGLRNHYLCAIYAARLMVPRKQGLIVNISSPGGLRYFLNVPYGIGKEACDRMAADCALELRGSSVAFVSLWPGTVSTETVTTLLQQSEDEQQPKIYDDGIIKMSTKKALELFETSESPEFPGKCVVGLATDAGIMKKSGRVLLTSDLAREYGFADTEGHSPGDIRQVKYLLRIAGFQKTSSLVPGFVRIPKWMLYLAGYKL